MATYSRYPRRVHFDMDSYEILVDNCCRKSITNCLEDFVIPPRSSSMIIKGFNGATATTKVAPRWVQSNGDYKMAQDRYTLSHCQRPITLRVWKTGSYHHSIGHRWLNKVKAPNAPHAMTV